MAKIHGKDSPIQLGDTDISRYVKSVDPDLFSFDNRSGGEDARTFVSGMIDATGVWTAEAERLFGPSGVQHMTMDSGRRWWQLRRRTGHFGDVKVTGSDEDPMGFTVNYEAVGPLRKVRAWTKRGLARKIRKAAYEGAGT